MKKILVMIALGTGLALTGNAQNMAPGIARPGYLDEVVVSSGGGVTVYSIGCSGIEGVCFYQDQRLVFVHNISNSFRLYEALGDPPIPPQDPNQPFVFEAVLINPNFIYQPNP